MNMKYKLIIPALFAALLLTACSQPPAPVAASSAPSAAPDSSSSIEASSASQPEPADPSPDTEEEPGISEQIAALYNQLDTSSIPQLEERLWDSFIDLKAGTPETLPPQIMRDEPKSYELAQLIRSVLYPNDNIPNDFDRISDAYQPALIQTALYHTPPLDLSWSWDGDTNGISANLYQDHVVTTLLKNELEEGRSPSNVYSADDVRTTLRKLYGIEGETIFMDIPPYYYYAREDVFIQMGDWGGPMWRYPQITSYQETADGLVCEAVIIWALDRNTPLEENGVNLTSQNFEKATAGCPKFQYTFQRAADDDRLLLTGVKILRKGAE